MELLIEDATPELSEYLTDFCTHVCNELDMPEHPDMTFVEKTGATSFGSYRPADGSIIVATGGRHVADILRTLAHEIIHDAQHLNGDPNLPLDELEYEANAMAGMLMRDWNKSHPGLYGADEAEPTHASEEGESQGAVFPDPTRPSGPIEMGESHELVLWGLPKGKTDRLHEVILSTQCKTQADLNKIKAKATQDGWHGFRVSHLDLSEKPDFVKAINEDGVVNSAGSGAIAGLGVGPQGEPGVHPKKKKTPILQPLARRKTFATLREEVKDPAIEARKKLAAQKIPVDAKTLLARRKLVAQIDAKKKGNLP